MSSHDDLIFDMFVDGEPLVNRTWTALTRRLCDALAPAAPAACGAARRVLHFRVAGHALAAGPDLDAAVALAVDVATSRAALPVHFDTDDDGLPPGDPSYVDVEATTAVSCAVDDDGGAATCDYTVLAAFDAAAFDACAAGGFPAGLVYGLRHAAGLSGLAAADVAVYGC